VLELLGALLTGWLLNKIFFEIKKKSKKKFDLIDFGLYLP